MALEKQREQMEEKLRRCFKEIKRIEERMMIDAKDEKKDEMRVLCLEHKRYIENHIFAREWLIDNQDYSKTRTVYDSKTDGVYKGIESIKRSR